MKIFTNSKQIPANIFYNLLKTSFKEMFPDKGMGYGLTENTVTVEKEGIPLYTILISPELIEISPVSEAEATVGAKLEKFVEASLHEGK